MAPHHYYEKCVVNKIRAKQSTIHPIRIQLGLNSRHVFNRLDYQVVDVEKNAFKVAEVWLVADRRPVEHQSQYESRMFVRTR